MNRRHHYNYSEEVRALGELGPLESLSPEERWQEDEVIPIPVPCDPRSNNGLHYRFIYQPAAVGTTSYETKYNSGSSSNLEEYVAKKLVALKDNDFLINGPQGLMESTNEPIGPNDMNMIYLNQLDNTREMQIEAWDFRNTSTTMLTQQLPQETVPLRSTHSDLRDFLNQRRQARDNGCTEMPSGHQEMQDQQDIFLYGESQDGWPDLDFLCKMRHIAFVDLDNWPNFFSKMIYELQPGTFIWGFYGGGNNYKPPKFCLLYEKLMAENCFHLHPKCGPTKDAADFAICTTAGILDAHLPKHIPFTVISGDKGFQELGRQLHLRNRIAFIVDPHSQDVESIYHILYVGQEYLTDVEEQDIILQE